MKRHYGFFYRNGLSLCLIGLFLISIVGQIYTGWHEHNSELREYDADPIELSEYLVSGHFVQATFENWESEFLQMGMYVLLTISLRQQGSSESKALNEKEEVDREPDPKRKGAPWPVRKGGFILKVYKNSLSLAFAALFMLSFAFHFTGSIRTYNEEQKLKKMPTATMAEYISGSRFWFESFQNWQSEFVAVISIVLLSIYLRQMGSPESKPVDAPHVETGE